MKYFVDDDHWDLLGYVEELKKILPRFNKETSSFLKKHSFHDGKVVSITAVNQENGQTKDPTTIKMVIEQYEEGAGIFEIQWLNVRKFLMDFDITRNVYGNKPNEIVFGGRKGLDDWGYDEILPLSKKNYNMKYFYFHKRKYLYIALILKSEKLRPRKQDDFFPYSDLLLALRSVCFYHWSIC